MPYESGAKVRLHTPDNPRLHGAIANVVEATDWGAHVKTPAAASGQYRAAHTEMVPLGGRGLSSESRARGYTGDVCDHCGSLTLRRNGVCLLCDTCGVTSGCS